MQKLYCYVDETGQHTEGAFFLVSVVITASERDEILTLLASIEQRSKKNNRKWSKSTEERNLAYIKLVLGQSILKGKLFYGTATQTQEYTQTTVAVTANAIANYAEDEYKAVVIVDGLPRNEERTFAASLRKRRIRTEKVRGTEDETDPLIRLADAICGFLRQAIHENHTTFRELYDKVKRDKYFVEVQGK